MGARYRVVSPSDNCCMVATGLLQLVGGWSWSRSGLSPPDTGHWA